MTHKWGFMSHFLQIKGTVYGFHSDSLNNMYGTDFAGFVQTNS